jgi:serine/threonine-protein phosphatase 2A regulatory subunit A
LTFQTIAPSLNNEIVSDEIIDALLHLATDPIPNIRFNVAKSLEIVATTYGKTPEGKELAQQKVVPVLEELKTDQDADVRYFATLACQRTLATIQG